MSEQLARFNPGQNVPGFTTVALAAGRFVRVSGAKTAQGDYPLAYATAAEGPVFGVTQGASAAATESEYSVERRINVIRRGAIARVEAGTGDVTVGAELEVGADGKAVELSEGVAVGKALTAGDDGEIIEVDLY